MRLSNLLLISLIFSFTLSCASSKTYERSVFTFVYEDDTYEIISMSLPDRAGFNILQMFSQEGELLLQGQDNDSDGRLDTLYAGNIPLEEANAIYNFGIDEAINSGKLEMRTDIRIFELVRADGTYIIETIGYDDTPRIQSYGYVIEPRVRIFNEFSILQPDGQERVTFTDNNANGVLALPETGEGQEMDPQELQDLYRVVLDAGIERGRIVEANNMYIVQAMSWNPI